MESEGPNGNRAVGWEIATLKLRSVVARSDDRIQQAREAGVDGDRADGLSSASRATGSSRPLQVGTSVSRPSEKHGGGSVWCVIEPPWHRATLPPP